MERTEGARYVWFGRVLQVIDPGYFWMQLGSEENLKHFEKFEDDLQQFARRDWHPASSVTDLEMGSIVMVDSETKETARWKRGQVVSIMQDNTLDIFYIDYGNSELTEISKICSSFPEAFTMFPPQAVRCCLAGVKPLVKNWTSRGTRTFQQLTNNRLLNVVFLSEKPGYYEVALYQSDDENGQSVAHMLIAEDVAVPVDDQQIPEFARDIPAFIAQVYQEVAADSENISFESDNKSPESDHKTNDVSPSAEKYVPPHQKSLGGSPRAAGSVLTNQNHSPQSSGSSIVSGTQSSNSGVKTSPHIAQGTKVREPVNDFFPFDNVSVYPPSPVSQVKSPNRTGGYGNNGSYFSNSVGRYSQNNNINQGQNERFQTGAPNNMDYHRQQQQQPKHHHDKSRFAANFENLPAPTNTFEPEFMKLADKSPPNNRSATRSQMESGSHRSPNKSLSDSEHSPRPRLNITNSNSNTVPFYPPPPPQMGDSRNGYGASNMFNLTPPYAFEQHHVAPHLTPPGFYQSNIPPPPLKPTGPVFNQPGSSAPFYNQPSPPQRLQTSSPIKVPQTTHNSTYDSQTSRPYPSNQYQDPFYKPDYRPGFDNNGTPRSPGNSVITSRSPSYNSGYISNYNNNSNAPMRTSAKFQTTPTKHQSFESHKLSPESPDSPAIGAFNLGDLEHTQNTSTDHFHRQMYEQRLQALQEEAEEIQKESHEQAELIKLARYGSTRIHSVEADDPVPPSDGGDIYDQIAQEIEYTSKHHTKEPEDLKKTPVSTTGTSKEKGRPPKLEGIPQNYITDINFAEAVKEALESGKTDGMVNARLLLDAVVESLKSANAEKQLYDVLLLMLGKAVKEYNLYHIIVMDTINTLNGEMEIKDCLSRALKRQQELCVRVPAPKPSFHLDFSRVMGHIFNLSLEWSDSNASIQDGILVTVEKWILFNNKGTQIGQIDKENIFLDCFGAFWEVSGTQLVQHNQAFRLRIRDEVRKKLLNENVSRGIRERLLDIMLELFTLSIEKVEHCTQTPRRTMIPSSCQVKPSTCDQATYISTDILEADVYGNLNVESPAVAQWYASSASMSSSSSDTVINLRPMGRGQALVTHRLSSTPHDSFYSAKSDDTMNDEEQDGSGLTDVTESFYETPQESFASESVNGTPKLNELFKKEKEKEKEKVSNSSLKLSDFASNSGKSGLKLSDLFTKEQESVVKSEQTTPKLSELYQQEPKVVEESKRSRHDLAFNSDIHDKVEFAGVGAESAQVSLSSQKVEKGDRYDSEVNPADQNFNQNNNTNDTKSEKRGPSRKSIVDWFDYEPSPSDSVRSGAKLKEKQLETRKKLDSTSMEIIEHDVALKYSPVKTEHSVKADHGVTADHNVKADHGVKADHNVKADHGVKANHNVKADHGVKADHNVKADHGVKADHNVKADHGVKADHNVKADHGVKADHNVKADHSNKKKSKKDKDRKALKNSLASETEKLKLDKSINSAIKHPTGVEKQVDHDTQNLNNKGKVTANKTDKIEEGSIENVADKDVDWWGAGEMPDTVCFSDSRRMEDNVHIDNGPDVIIEGEFEHVEASSSVYAQLNDKTDNHPVSDEKATNKESNEFDLKKYLPEENFGDFETRLSPQPDIEENQMMTKHLSDDFAFDVNYYDEGQWESDNSDDLNVNEWLGLNGAQAANFDEDFPQTDLRSVLQLTDNTDNAVQHEVPSSKRHKNFPKTNLAEYIKDTQDIVEPPRPARWVPGRRVCFTCNSPDHTTDACPTGHVIIQ